MDVESLPRRRLRFSSFWACSGDWCLNTGLQLATQNDAHVVPRGVSSGTALWNVWDPWKECDVLNHSRVPCATPWLAGNGD